MRMFNLVIFVVHSVLISLVPTSVGNYLRKFFEGRKTALKTTF